MSSAPDLGNPAPHRSPGAAERPDFFGPYLLLRAFARGGMGEVYLARYRTSAGEERFGVLKKLRPELTRDTEYVRRFIDEARIVVQLNHPNICHVFDVGRVGDEYYLAMEYVSGRDVRTLQDRAREQRIIPSVPVVVHLLCEVLESLDYAHQRVHPLTGEPLNLIHRDVSPQNVMVSFDGDVKLIDFGLASSKLKMERTQPNVVMGKMAYMAPEQARGESIDARVDLFAAGVLGYELLAGERYYEGMASHEIWTVVGRGDFVPRKWDTLEKDLAKILRKALHPEVSQRFSSCFEFHNALAKYLDKHHPGAGAGPLVDLIQRLFPDEIAREREMLQGYGFLEDHTLTDDLEASRSMSVSLAHADYIGTPPTLIDGAMPGSRVARDELGGDTLSDDAAGLSEDTDQGGPETSRAHDATGRMPTADATLFSEAGSTEAPRSAEHTEMVQRATSGDATSGAGAQRARRTMTAAVLIVGLFALLFGGYAWIRGGKVAEDAPPGGQVAPPTPAVARSPDRSVRQAEVVPSRGTASPAPAPPARAAPDSAARPPAPAAAAMGTAPLPAARATPPARARPARSPDTPAVGGRPARERAANAAAHDRRKPKQNRRLSTSEQEAAKAQPPADDPAFQALLRASPEAKVKSVSRCGSCKGRVFDALIKLRTKEKTVSGSALTEARRDFEQAWQRCYRECH